MILQNYFEPGPIAPCRVPNMSLISTANVKANLAEIFECTLFGYRRTKNLAARFFAMATANVERWGSLHGPERARKPSF